MSERHQGKIPTDPRLQEMIIGESVRRYYASLEEQRLHIETIDDIEIDATMPEDFDESELEEEQHPGPTNIIYLANRKKKL